MASSVRIRNLAQRELFHRYRPVAQTTWWYASSSFTYSVAGLFLLSQVDRIKQLEAYPLSIGTVILSDGAHDFTYHAFWVYEAFALILQGFVSYYTDVRHYGFSRFGICLDRCLASFLFTLQVLKKAFLPFDLVQNIIYTAALVLAVLTFVGAQISHRAHEEVIGKRIYLKEQMMGGLALEIGKGRTPPEFIHKFRDAEGGNTNHRNGCKRSAQAFPTLLQTDQNECIASRSGSASADSAVIHPVESFWTETARALRLVPASQTLMEALNLSTSVRDVKLVDVVASPSDSKKSLPKQLAAVQFEEVLLFRSFLLFHTLWHYSIPVAAGCWIIYSTCFAI
jgi:hypothetical protein